MPAKRKVALSHELRTAVEAYIRGDVTLEELRSEVLASLTARQVPALFDALPTDAMVELIHRMTEASAAGQTGSGSLVDLGTFKQDHTPAQRRRFIRNERTLHDRIRSTDASLQSLDLERAAQNTRSDSFLDWYRDPWGWPELNFLAHAGREYVLARALQHPGRATYVFDVPKSASENRPAVLLDLTDRVLFQACTDTLTPAVNGLLPRWVYGWRLPFGDRSAGHYARNDFQWNNYVGRLRRSARDHGLAFHSDIENYFASLSPTTIDTVVRQVATDRVGDMIMAIVQAASQGPMRSGMPQRSTASCVIANLILSSTDALAEGMALGSGSDIRPTRWMDDMWLFGSAQSKLEPIVGALSANIAELGLQWKAAKTGFFEGQALDQQIDRLGLSYVDIQLQRTPPDARGLEAALAVLLESPEEATRHEINFVTSRIKQYKRTELAQALTESALKMRHGADFLASMLKKLELYRDLGGWCDSLLSGPSLPWVKASFLRMWPLDELPAATFVARLVELASDASTPSIVRAILFSRLSRWRPQELRSVFGALERDDMDPLSRRALGIAAVTAGLGRREIRKFLLEEDTTNSIAGFLDEVGYSPAALDVVV